jgi:hypothetical protein
MNASTHMRVIALAPCKNVIQLPQPPSLLTVCDRVIFHFAMVRKFPSRLTMTKTNNRLFLCFDQLEGHGILHVMCISISKTAPTTSFSRTHVSHAREQATFFRPTIRRILPQGRAAATPSVRRNIVVVAASRSCDAAFSDFSFSSPPNCTAARLNASTTHSTNNTFTHGTTEAVVEGGCEVGKTVRVAELILYNSFSPHIISFQSYSSEFPIRPT